MMMIFGKEQQSSSLRPKPKVESRQWRLQNNVRHAGDDITHCKQVAGSVF